MALFWFLVIWCLVVIPAAAIWCGWELHGWRQRGRTVQLAAVLALHMTDRAPVADYGAIEFGRDLAAGD